MIRCRGEPDLTVATRPKHRCSGTGRSASNPRFQIVRSFHLGYWIPVCTGLTKASLTNTVITAQAGIQKSLVNQILRDTNIVWSNR